MYYFENRQPRAIKIDESFYLIKNPDVAEHVREGIFESGQAHFDISAFQEGRLPYHHFSLFYI